MLQRSLESCFSFLLRKQNFPITKESSRSSEADEMGSIVFAIELYLCFGDHKHIVMLDSPDLVLLCVGPKVK